MEYGCFGIELWVGGGVVWIMRYLVDELFLGMGVFVTGKMQRSQPMNHAKKMLGLAS